MGEMLAEMVADPDDTPSYAQYRFRIPAGATEVLLIRHGESAPMAAGEGFPVTADGQADPELSPLGREQAERLAERLASVHLDALYVTSLRRTAQTAQPLTGQSLALASGARPLAFMSCDNTSISQLILHEEHWIVRRFNDTEHLGPAF